MRHLHGSMWTSIFEFPCTCFTKFMYYEIYRHCQISQKIYQFPVDINCFGPLTKWTLRNSNKMTRLMSDVLVSSHSRRDRWQRSKVGFSGPFGLQKWTVTLVDSGRRVEEGPLLHFFLKMWLKDVFSFLPCFFQTKPITIVNRS